MKKWFLVLLLVVSRMSGTALAQNITAQGTVTLNAGTQTAPVNGIDLRNTGTSSISFTWSTTPAVTAGTCQMQQATTNAGPWTNFGAPFTVTSSGGPLTVAMVVNYIRFTCPTPITGGGSVGIRYVGILAPATAGTGSDVNVTNPSLVVTQSNPANFLATVSGTVTANAGTGFGGVGQGSTTTGQTGTLMQCAVTTAAPTYTTGQTNPCSLDTTGGLRVSGIAGGGGLGQGTMTAGQLGTLIQAAATTAAPTYTTGTTNPLSMDLTGALRVNVVAGGGSGGGTSSNFAAAFPTVGTAIGYSDGTNMQGARVYDANSGAGVEYVQGVNLRSIGAAGSLELGIAGNPMKVDPTGTTTQPVSGTITANAGTGNFTVVQATAANLNATVTGTVTANAGTGFAGVAQGSTTAGQTGNLIMGAVTTAAPTYTTATTNALSLDTTGALRVNVVAGGGSGGGTSSNFAAAFPMAGTAAGFTDGTNMQGARVFDVDSGAGTQYVQGVNLRLTGAGGSVEFGTGTAPIRIDPTGTTTQPVSGTVTANAGTGSFTVIQPTAANLNAVVSQATGTNLHVVVDTAPSTAVTGAVTVSQATGTNLHVVVDSAPSTAVTGTVTANAGTGWFLTQGSTTTGQTGSLSMCAATTAAPTYTTGQTNPCSLDLSGNLRVALPGVQQVQVTNMGGTAVATNTGTANAGTQRIVFATDQATNTNPFNVQFPSAQAMNITQVGGTGVVTATAGLMAVAIRDSSNNPILASADPCSGSLTALVANSITADTQIIGLSGAGKKRYYCSIALNNGDAAANEKVSIVESTTAGGTCTTTPSVVWGSSTSDANGWLLSSAGGGVVTSVLRAGPLTNAATCIKVNTGGLQIDYIITYIDQ